MRYSHVAAWSVIGGISMTQDTTSIELSQSRTTRFVLTCDPDSLLKDIDRGAAVGRLLMKALFNSADTRDLAAALESEISVTSEERNRNANAFPSLVIIASGEVDASIRTPIHEHELRTAKSDTKMMSSPNRFRVRIEQLSRVPGTAEDAVLLSSRTKSFSFHRSTGTKLPHRMQSAA